MIYKRSPLWLKFLVILAMWLVWAAGELTDQHVVWLPLVGGRWPVRPESRTGFWNSSGNVVRTTLRGPFPR